MAQLRIIIKDVNGNKCAETDYGYDEYGLDSSGVTEQHGAAPNSVIGNQTSVTRQFFGNPCTSSAPSETPYKTIAHFYDTGAKHTTTDPNQNTTTYAYSSTFYGAYVTQTTFPSTSSPNLANHVTSGNYDLNTGLLTSFTDQNNSTTSYTYDVMLRPTNVTYPSPDGGQTNFYYPNTATVEMQRSIDGTRWTDSFVYYDGLGREIRRMSVNDESLPYDQVDTCYDTNGRVGFKSYPYQGNGISTPKVCSGAGDTFGYDPLNRTTSVTHSDGTSVSTTYTDASGHTGRATSILDEGNGTARVQRISQVDGMGRLTSVCEVSSATALGSGGTPAACNQDIAGTGFLTSYMYDPMGNLTSVSQGGYLPRSYAYDSLSRVVTASNPEAGTIAYKYDVDTNCSQPNSFATLLVSRVDARGIRTCMRYDALNRMTQKNYSDGTPTATFNFDETSAFGIPLANTTGRASSKATASPNPTGEVFSYDKLGRVKTNSQCTPQNCGSAVFSIAYAYDLLGDTLTETNGTGVTLTYPPYNRALRIMGMSSSLSDSNHPGTIYSSPHYSPTGSVTSASFGNSGNTINETRTYDGRLRLASITDGSVYSLSIPSVGGYAPDGDVLQANDSVNGTWSYSYDEMNRVCNANHSSTAPTCHQSATITYGYDRFGNLWQGDGGLSISFTGNNNRIDGLATHYDSAGNLLYDGVTAYSYDAENRIVSVTNASGSSSYVYDAEGRRVRKTTPAGGTLDFLYDLAGREITQLTSAGSWTRGEIYVGGEHLGTYVGGTSGSTYFSFSDWLRTERARSAPGATSACETITSLPFGDGLTTAGNCGDPSPMHFTGKDRDSESGLDNFGARYNSSQYGRFMSPDSGHFLWPDPQTLNRYSYTRNNPLKYIDPTGNYFVIASDVLPQVRQFISTLLRTDAGRTLVLQIATSPRVNSIDSGSLPRTQLQGNQVAVTNGSTTPVPGNAPGVVAGTETKLDFNNIGFTAEAMGQTDFRTGLLAFTHEAFHVTDMNSAATFQGAAVAGAEGDAPSRPGASDTVGGTAEARAQGLLSGLGDAASDYTSDPTADQLANQLISYGQALQSGPVPGSVQLESAPIDQDLAPPCRVDQDRCDQ